MKTFAATLLLLLPIALPAQTNLTVPLDPKVSQLKWTGHAEVGTYAPSGTLSIRQGQIAFQDGRFAGATMTVDMNSMQQDNAALLHHLKSSDFFDVEHYPASVITIDRIANGTVFGTLTIKAKTTPFQCPVQLTQTGNRFTIVGKLQLDRTVYGIVYFSNNFFSGLGNKAIRNTFEVEFTLAGDGVIPSAYRS